VFGADLHVFDVGVVQFRRLTHRSKPLAATSLLHRVDDTIPVLARNIEKRNSLQIFLPSGLTTRHCTVFHRKHFDSRFLLQLVFNFDNQLILKSQLSFVNLPAKFKNHGHLTYKLPTSTFHQKQNERKHSCHSLFLLFSSKHISELFAQDLPDRISRYFLHESHPPMQLLLHAHVFAHVL
jgi:hypothetical protein